MRTKKSKKGLLFVGTEKGEYFVKDQVTKEEESGSQLTTVFLDGKLVRTTTLDEIRQRLS